MKKFGTFSICLLTTMLLSLICQAQSSNNAELQRMTDEDQAARKGTSTSWQNLYLEDSLRRVRLYEMIKANFVITSKDHYNAALIFQHGVDTIDSGNAVSFMRKAIELDPSMDKWLLAAAIDRDLMRKGKPQIYGTQFIKDRNNDRWKLYDLDSTAVTDEERMIYRVGTVEQQRERERLMNMKSIFDYAAEHGSVDATLNLIESEFKKGNQSEYDVSEREINQYGYEFLNAGYLNEALQIFKLNTKLYPKGYNTWDSLGECQFKMGDKKSSYKSYKKSLRLNSENENARVMMKECRK